MAGRPSTTTTCSGVNCSSGAKKEVEGTTAKFSGGTHHKNTVAAEVTRCCNSGGKVFFCFMLHQIYPPFRSHLLSTEIPSEHPALLLRIW
ncbi:MAG: hypothetical protein ACK53Y_04290 [bacterium]